MNTCKLPKIFKPYKNNNLIRLGKFYDGGYLVSKKDVENTKHLISLGIGTDWSFERDFLTLNNCKLTAFDSSVEDSKSLESFFRDNKLFVKKNITSKLFDEVIKEEKIFLKCDIEGSEYELLESLVKFSSLFTGIVIEFHKISDSNNLSQICKFIQNIRLKIAHVHVNNYFYYKAPEENIPDVIEITFTSDYNVQHSEVDLPRFLDMPNNPLESDFKITFV